MAQLTEYLWIVIVGFFFAFLYAFGIGANDVANAFGSTVASKSLTLKQAVLVASMSSNHTPRSNVSKNGRGASEERG